MLIKLIGGPYPQGSTPGEYDAVFLQAYNNFAGTIPLGGHVCYDPLATVGQNLGRAVTRPVTANLVFYAGSAIAAIPQAEWGLVQCYGVMEEMGQDGGTTATAVGNTLLLATGVFYPHTPVAGTYSATFNAWISVLEIVSTATGTGRGMIRAM